MFDSNQDDENSPDAVINDIIDQTSVSCEYYDLDLIEKNL